MIFLYLTAIEINHFYIMSMHIFYLNLLQAYKTRRKGYNFFINAYQTYADTYLIDLVRTKYLREGCLTKIIKYPSTDMAMEQGKKLFS